MGRRAKKDILAWKFVPIGCWAVGVLALVSFRSWTTFGIAAWAGLRPSPASVAAAAVAGIGLTVLGIIRPEMMPLESPPHARRMAKRWHSETTLDLQKGKSRRPPGHREWRSWLEFLGRVHAKWVVASMATVGVTWLAWGWAFFLVVKGAVNRGGAKNLCFHSWSFFS